MKHAIIIAMLAGSAMGQESVVRYTDGWSTVLLSAPTLSTNMVVTNAYTYTKVIEIPDSIIASAITNGTVCRVRGGHVWKSSAVIMDNAMFGGGVRVCELCEARQKRVEGWVTEQ
jgi:hypothetical protein